MPIHSVSFYTQLFLLVPRPHFSEWLLSNQDYILWCIDRLLGKDLKTNNRTTAVALQQCGKHTSTRTELLLEMVFSMWSLPRSYFMTVGVTQFVARMEAESNTSTVTLRVVGGDERGSLKSETVKYGREYQGTQTQERLRWQGSAAYTKGRLVLSSERAAHKNQDCNCQTVINIWSWATDGARYQDLLTDWLTDWLTNWPSVAMTLTLTQLVESHPMKRRLGGWCEMATSLGVSWELSSVWEAVKIEPECMKLKDLHC
jgi:hypothetical protein